MTNSSESTGTFRRRLTSADASNIVPVLDMLTLNGQYAQFEEDFILGFAGMLESLQVSVGLFSLKPADFPAITPLMSEAAKQAEIARVRTDGQKMGLSLWIAKGNGPWEYASECVLQNNANSESYVPLLVPFLTVNEVLLIDRDFRLGVKVENKWQGVLKTNDYLVISGSWRQRITFSAKKNEELVLINNRVIVQETAIASLLTPNWQGLSYQGGWTPTLAGNPPPGVRKFGKVGTLRGLFTVGTSSADGTQIATIPEGYRPRYPFDAPIIQWLPTGYAFGAMYVLTTGEILVFTLSGGVSNVSVAEISFELP